jgi:hypothetical protein
VPCWLRTKDIHIYATTGETKRISPKARGGSGLALHRGDVRFLQIAAQLTAEAAVALVSGSTAPWPEGADLANATLALRRVSLDRSHPESRSDFGDPKNGRRCAN